MLISHMSPMLSHAFPLSSPLSVVSNVNLEYLVLITDGVVALFLSRVFLSTIPMIANDANTLPLKQHLHQV